METIETHLGSLEINNIPLVAPDGDGPDSGTLYISITVDDPECIEALCQYPDGRQRQDFVRSALKIGILAIKHARGRIDGEAVRREGERLIASLAEKLESYQRLTETKVTDTLKHYFDPKDGRFNERVERLVHQDGELAKAMQLQIGNAENTLRQVLAQHLGENSQLLKMLTPDESNALIAGIRTHVESVLSFQRDRILHEFSLDQPDSALSRLIREITEKHGAAAQDLGKRISDVVSEFSLDREDSALSRLVKRVDDAQKRINAEFSLDAEQSALARMRRELMEVLEKHQKVADEFQKNVLSTLEALKARKEESARSTTHGHTFHAETFQLISDFCQRAGDVATDVGNGPGAINRCKVGDFLIQLGPDCAAAGARIIVEAKEDASYNLNKTLDEIKTARENRQAGVGLFVHSKKTAPMNMQMLSRYGNDVVVVWDAEDDATDVVLKAGLLVAKAISLQAKVAEAGSTASFSEINSAIHNIQRQVQFFEEIKTKSTTIKNNAEWICTKAESMLKAITAQVDVLESQIENLQSN